MFAGSSATFSNATHCVGNWASIYKDRHIARLSNCTNDKCVPATSNRPSFQQVLSLNNMRTNNMSCDCLTEHNDHSPATCERSEHRLDYMTKQLCKTMKSLNIKTPNHVHIL